MFVIFLIGEKEFEIHISKASRTAKEWEVQGVKFTIKGVKYYSNT